jgi:hypothetical protein
MLQTTTSFVNASWHAYCQICHSKSTTSDNLLNQNNDTGNVEAEKKKLDTICWLPERIR